MEKVDIAKLLMGCTQGLELDCTIYEGVTFVRVDIRDYEFYPIKLKTRSGLELSLTKYGQYARHEDSKCVIFPKGKTSWEDFVTCEFKDGDIIIRGRYIAIFWYIKPNGLIYYHCWYDTKYKDVRLEKDFGIGNINDKPMTRLATEEEKKTLFDVIEAKGYKWNEETNTLEKLIIPEFKIGDKIQCKCDYPNFGYKVEITEVNLKDKVYVYESVVAKEIDNISFEDQDEWELVPNKFDVATIKPFDKVLGRNSDHRTWECDLFSYYNNDSEACHKFHCIGVYYKYCIPYEGNEKLLGTTNDCDDYYKTWEE